MNAPVANLPTKVEKKSVLVDMATRFGMEPKAFSDTLCATVFPKEASNEEFIAFLLVAKEYNLNPLTKEIYAFPKKGGGIQPIVSVDGWCRIINENPQLDGIEFDDHQDDKGKITAITARIWRKDRAKPIVCTEYMDECVRGDVDTWKRWPRRMLRHKALIQCARYGFGYAGIVDPDEAERIGVVSPMRDVTPKDDGPPPPPPATSTTPPAATQTRRGDADLDGLDIPQGLKRNGDNTLATPEDVFDGAGWLNDLAGAYSGCEDAAGIYEVDQKVLTPNIDKAFPPDRKKAIAIRQENFTRVLRD